MADAEASRTKTRLGDLLIGFCHVLAPLKHVVARWEQSRVRLEAVQQRLDANPQAMRQRRETVEHPFGTMKARMGTKTLPKVAAEMALSVLDYNLTRVMNIVGIKPLVAAIAVSRSTYFDGLSITIF